MEESALPAAAAKAFVAMGKRTPQNNLLRGALWKKKIFLMN